ncbi:glycosyltransferase [Photorhabdus khanii]|uniref:Glycosyltransferase n=1 Tax=Photorhabdus khanii TaxID=1004150 RepID=A0A7C9KSU4_9GAMM|nr:glycosyltransferase [Photorhabdus khanii]MQL46649.1 glycosyltransferase [Photorhabdus khanii]
MKTKKIVLVAYNIPGFGGRETVCKKLVALLSKESLQLDISFLFINDIRQESVEIDDGWLNGMSFHRIHSGIYNTKVRRIHFAFSFSKFMRKEKPDIVIAIDPLSCYITSLAKKLIFSKTPIFSWIHSSLEQLYKNIYVIKADYHLSISSGITQQLIDRGVNPDKIFTIFNPVSQKSETIPRPSGNITKFLYVGRLTDDDKNISGMFKALSQVHGDWELNIVGSGRDEKILRSVADRLNITSNIIWHGWHNEPWHYIIDEIKEITVLLLTSNFEGFPMVLGEANAQGIYCISSDCKTGPADIIKDEINGELYPVDKPHELVIKLQNIINGKKLTDNRTIKMSISNLYDLNYLKRVKSALNI